MIKDQSVAECMTAFRGHGNHAVSTAEESRRTNWFAIVATTILLVAGVGNDRSATAQKVTMRHGRMLLTHILPAGAQRGTTAEVRLWGWREGLAGATGLVIDGPGGVTVKDCRLENGSLAVARLNIAADAPFGRRRIRVRGGVSGLTNFRWFIVGALPEQLEKENNNRVAEAQPVSTPVVINGRIEKQLDQDVFHFEGRRGQTIIAAILSDRLGSMMSHWRDNSSADLTLEVLDSTGRVIAEADDTLGLDPVVTTTLPADGSYIARINGVGYQGFESQVYRLTLGDVPYPVAAYPAGGRRGEQTQMRFLGYNLPENAGRLVEITDAPHSLQWVQPETPFDGIASARVLRSDTPETVEAEPNDDRKKASPLVLPVTANGRVNEANDIDWYSVKLKKGQRVRAEIFSQRRLASRLDLRLDAFSPDGELCGTNDDIDAVSEAGSDFRQPFDPFLVFQAERDGGHRIRVSEQTGSAGPNAIYRLDVELLEPGFRLYQWPDAVPVWGAGSTASLIVDMEHWGGLRSPVTVHIEGLPDGWQGSSTVLMPERPHWRRASQGPRRLLTITAPEDAERGDLVSFRVVGEAEQEGRRIRHIAEPVAKFGAWRDVSRKRLKPGFQSRAVVAQRFEPWFEAGATRVEATRGQKVVKVPVVVRGVEPRERIPVSVDHVSSRTRSAFMAPAEIEVGADGESLVPVNIEGKKPGRYDIVVSTRWVSEIRKGMPGPCTPLVQLDIRPEKQ